MRLRLIGHSIGKRDGQAAIFAVLSLTVVFASMGLAVDIGNAYFQKQAAQTAADSAAMAAIAYASASGTPACGTGGVQCASATACSYPNTTPPTNDFQVACLYAQSNGFVNNGNQTVTVAGNTTAPPGVTGNTPSYWVQVTVGVTPNTLFGSFGGFKALNVNASAMAAVTSYSVNACIYAVGSGSIADAFSATGAAVVTASCGIFVNSSSSSAFYESGSPSVTASQILVNGGKSVSGSSSVSPTPTTNAGAQNDPLASFAEPTFSNSSCAYNNTSVTGITVTTLSAGVYCGGVSIGNSSKVTFSNGGNSSSVFVINGGLSIGGASTATFQPGLYIINGSMSGDSVSFGNSAAITGSGVTFFITGQYGQTMGPVQMTGATTVNLAAPTSGTYQGMLFLQDRNLTYSTTNSFANSASSVLQGTLYFPTTSITYSGASTTGTYTALIAKTVSFTGSAAFKNDPTGEYTGLATSVRGLIQ